VQFAETYRGASAGSEPETQALMAFHAAHRPVLALSYHSYSGLILYPWGFRSGALAPDLPRFQALAGTDLAPAIRDDLPESSIDRYHPGPGWNLYPTNGEYTDWAYRAHGTIAFTVELTSGCCANGLGYGFEFPEDSARVEQVFRDNLPFALSLIAASSDQSRASGAQRFTALWPEAWLSLDVNEPRPNTLTLRTRVGGLSSRGMDVDSLGRGTLRTVWRSDLRLDGVRALRAEGSGVTGELIAIAGAEPQDPVWHGWWRDTIRLAGQYSWYTAGTNDTLTSPSVDLRGRTAVWLQFWTRHFGSTFTPEQHGIVQFSADSGHTWGDVAVLVGEGANWYPVRVDLPQAADARGARVRFISRNLTWWIDAVGVASDVSLSFLQVQAASLLEFSENPVRNDQVVISWPVPAPAADANLEAYTFTGERIFTATIAAPSNEYVWDLTLGGTRRVVNGAYIVVVEVGGQRYRRRLFVDRRAP
jgi:hypothetical protein